MNKAGVRFAKKFAKHLKISEKTLNNHLNNVTKVNTEYAVKYCRALNIIDCEMIVRIFYTMSRKGHREVDEIVEESMNETIECDKSDTYEITLGIDRERHDYCQN